MTGHAATEAAERGTSVQEVAELIARRCADPARLAEAITATARQSRYADLLPWRRAGLTTGQAGIAVLCAEMDRHHPGQGWDRTGHEHLAAAAAHATPHDPSLFSGLAGVGLAAILLAAGRPRYRRLLTTVDTTLAPAVDHASARLAAADGCVTADFDLVSGLTGTATYLLTRHRLTGDPTTLTRALSALTHLLETTANPSSPHPRRWHTPADLSTGSLRDLYPRGHHNCGLAHGAPGPLALLSLALIEGIEVPGCRAAIEATAAWLTAHHTGTHQEPDWPDAIPLDAPASPPGRRSSALRPPGRAAWCYGAPGVARSLWLAGTALRRPDWQEPPARTIRAVASRAPETWSLSTPAFCHGRAGLLQVLRRFATDLADPALTTTAHTLATALAAEHDPASVLGIRSIEPENVLVDHPGLLDGAPGIALALLGPPPPSAGPPTGLGSAPAGTGLPHAAWDRMFLLS